jgi:hypothetical protein
MHSFKLPLSPMWRCFDVEVTGELITLVWAHAGIPALTPVERYILDVASTATCDGMPGRIGWCFHRSEMDAVSELLVDAQEESGLAAFNAWKKWDPSYSPPAEEGLRELAKQVRRIDAGRPFDGPHVARRRKGADDAK